MNRAEKPQLRTWCFRSRPSSLAAGCLLAACSQPAEMTADMARPDMAAAASDMAAADMAPAGPPDVTGRRIRTHVSESGAPVDTAIDLRAATIEALVETSGSYTSYPGTGKGDGTFAVPGVPEGAPFYLHYYNAAEGAQHFYSYASSRSLDLSYYSGQRLGVSLGDSNTKLGFSGVGGLDAWGASDQLEYYSSDNELYLYGTGPAAGATTLDATQSFNGAPLVDSAAGDRLYILQLHDVTSAGGVTVQAATKSAKLSGLSMISGQTTQVTGSQISFSAPPTQSASFDFRRSQFAPFQGAAAPPGLSVGANYPLYVEAMLGGASLSYGFYTNGADLVAYNSASGTDVNLGQVTFGNPFSASYGLFGQAGVSFGVSYTVSGATMPATVVASLSQEVPLSAFTAGPIVPTLGPPANIKINGQDAFTTTANLTSQPVLSWSPPQLGTPTHYQVSVVRLYLRPSTTRTAQMVVAQIVTSQTRLVLPKGLLSAGESYVFRIASLARPSFDFSHPYRSTLPNNTAQALTVMLTP